MACAYQGYDLSAAMIEQAEALFSHEANVRFLSDPTRLIASQYTLASGLFNVSLGTPPAVWEEYMSATLDNIASITTRAFAFNVLTAYSDDDKRRSDLYYADPLFWFSHCRQRFSKYVALIHDYPLYEFTIHVRLTG
jgi:hypothetical protein